jgi:hypothetical protein
MHKITFGILARLTKDGAKDIHLLVYTYYFGRSSPCVTIEDGVNLGLTGGHIDSLEQVVRIAVDKHPGYVVQQRMTLEMEAPEIEDPNGDRQMRQSNIAALLLANRGGGTDWGEFSQPDNKPWSKKAANKFLLCCLLDFQIPSDVAWRNGYRLIEDILNDPDNVWGAITSVSASEWKSKRDEYKLHRFPAGHNRLWRIGRRICDEYAGDARRMWEGKDSPAVLETLWDLDAGDQISRMVVGALRDCGQIKGATSDVKADVYVCRVLGRAVLGETTDPETAVKLARQLHPADPWQLDAQLWYVGKSYCRARDPNCSQCYLASHCAYALRRSQGGSQN